MLIDELRKADNFCIFGAQVVAYGAYMAIRHLTGRTPVCFAVSCLNGNPKTIDGIEVRCLDDMSRDTYVIAAVTELIQKSALPQIAQMGFANVFALGAHEEHLLMKAYYDSIGKFPCATDTCRKEHISNHDIRMFEVCCSVDKPLSVHPTLHEYEYSIQAGSVLTKQRIAQLTDDTGDNISDRNKRYCEMSAAYWMWKNISCDWIGLEHYRRHLLIKPEYINDTVDVLMPLPYMCCPNELAQFRRFVGNDVVDALLKALNELHPDKAHEYIACIYGPYQYTYNLVCARKPVYDDYCSWFFEITQLMETYNIPEINDTRALSYVAEVLTNIYFMTNADKLRIYHVEKEIYC